MSHDFCSRLVYSVAPSASVGAPTAVFCASPCECWFLVLVCSSQNMKIVHPTIFYCQLMGALTPPPPALQSTNYAVFQIEETIVAGRRRALVTLGPSKHLGANSSSSSSSSRAACAEEEDGEGDGEARGLLVRGGSRAAMSGAAVSGAPVCAGVGLVPGVGSRRKAAVGAGRAKRRTSSGAGRRDAAAAGRGTSGSTCGIRGSGGGGGGCCARGVSSSGAGERCGGRGRGGGGREAGSSHPLKVSRRLFIEIENKASEPPPPRRAPPPDRRWRADRRHRLGAAVRGLDSNARTRRLGGGAHGNADDGQGDSDGESWRMRWGERALF